MIVGYAFLPFTYTNFTTCDIAVFVKLNTFVHSDSGKRLEYVT